MAFFVIALYSICYICYIICFVLVWFALFLYVILYALVGEVSSLLLGQLVSFIHESHSSLCKAFADLTLPYSLPQHYLKSH